MLKAFVNGMQTGTNWLISAIIFSDAFCRTESRSSILPTTRCFRCKRESVAGFQSGQERSLCACSGYPGMDWYRGKQRIALTSIQHGRAVRWEGFQGDAQLTQESGAWLVRWLVQHEVDEGKMALK